MTVSAYTLIRARSPKLNVLIAKIKRIEFVREVIPVYGEYDIVIKTETNSIEELNNFIFNELRKIKGVTKTTTMITALSKR